MLFFHIHNKTMCTTQSHWLKTINLLFMRSPSNRVIIGFWTPTETMAMVCDMISTPNTFGNGVSVRACTTRAWVLLIVDTHAAPVNSFYIYYSIEFNLILLLFMVCFLCVSCMILYFLYRSFEFPYQTIYLEQYRCLSPHTLHLTALHKLFRLNERTYRERLTYFLLFNTIYCYALHSKMWNDLFIYLNSQKLLYIVHFESSFHTFIHSSCLWCLLLLLHGF